MNIFDRINEWIRSVESSFINLVSAIVPWLAPLAPAYMTYQHAVNTLGFSNLIAVPVALLVEMAGISAVSTYTTFWYFNRRNPAAYKKAPTRIVVIFFLVYLTTIISSNVLLDAFEGQRWAVILVKAMLTIQTIPAAGIIVVRAGHWELLQEIKKERQEREQVARNEIQQPRQPRKQLPQVSRKAISDTDLLAYLQANPGESHQQVAQHFGVSRQAIGQRVKKLYEVKS